MNAALVPARAMSDTHLFCRRYGPIAAGAAAAAGAGAMVDVIVRRSSSFNLRLFDIGEALLM